MVEIRIVIEGGVLLNDNISAATVNNSERLRQSFHKLLSKVLNPDNFNIIVEIGAGDKNAAKSFKKHAINDSKTTLFVDLDGVKSIKHERLIELDIVDYNNQVFFMVQEMEAWILSQPEAIEKCYDLRFIRRKKDEQLTNHKLLLVHPEEITKPSKILEILLPYYYSEKKGDKIKKKKYGKLKDAPLLIEQLDFTKLLATFEDIKSFKDYTEKHSIL